MSTQTQSTLSPNGAHTPALELRGVSSGYGANTVLRDVSLTIERGSVTAILGANGAGKSTLLKTIAGVLRPTAGSVLLHGEEANRLAPHQRARKGLCYIPEGRAVFRSLTVRDNLRVQSVLGDEKTAVDRVAEAFPRLRDRLGQLAGTMSGGEQQMLAVARAYLTDPSVIVVDEASLGLAPKIVDDIFAFLERLARGGTALVVVDQFATRVLGMSERGHVMRRGEIVLSASAAELLESDLFAQYMGGEGDVHQ